MRLRACPVGLAPFMAAGCGMSRGMKLWLMGANGGTVVTVETT